MNLLTKFTIVYFGVFGSHKYSPGTLEAMCVCVYALMKLFSEILV